MAISLGRLTQQLSLWKMAISLGRLTQHFQTKPHETCWQQPGLMVVTCCYCNPQKIAWKSWQKRCSIKLGCGLLGSLKLHWVNSSAWHRSSRPWKRLRQRLGAPGMVPCWGRCINCQGPEVSEVSPLFFFHSLQCNSVQLGESRGAGLRLGIITLDATLPPGVLEHELGWRGGRRGGDTACSCCGYNTAYMITSYHIMSYHVIYRGCRKAVGLNSTWKIRMVVSFWYHGILARSS